MNGNNAARKCPPNEKALGSLMRICILHRFQNSIRIKKINSIDKTTNSPYFWKLCNYAVKHP